MARFRISVAAVLAAGLAAVAAPARAAAFPRRSHRPASSPCPAPPRASRAAVDVHLWYPTAAASRARRPSTARRCAAARSAPTCGSPLTWTVEAEIAREGAAIDPSGAPFPVIVFSHGYTNDPIDYAHTLELIAARGFIVAAPATRTTPRTTRGWTSSTMRPWPPAGRACSRAATGGPGPCSRPELWFSMADRVQRRLGGTGRAARPGSARASTWRRPACSAIRAGPSARSPRRAAVARAFAGARVPGGETRCWPLVPEPRIQAVMGLAIGALPSPAASTSRPSRCRPLLVAGGAGPDVAAAVSAARLRPASPSRRQDVPDAARPACTARSTRPTATRSWRRARSPRPRRTRSSTSTRSTASSIDAANSGRATGLLLDRELRRDTDIVNRRPADGHRGERPADRLRHRRGQDRRWRRWRCRSSRRGSRARRAAASAARCRRRWR